MISTHAPGSGGWGGDRIFHGFYLLLMKSLSGAACFAFVGHTAAHLCHLQRAPAEGGWKLHHLHQEFHQVSKVWVFQVSGCKYCWLLLCLRVQGTMTDHRELRCICVLMAAWNNSVVQGTFYLYQYLRCSQRDSETVIWDVLDSRPWTRQVSAQMGLVQSTALLSVQVRQESRDKILVQLHSHP